MLLGAIKQVALEEDSSAYCLKKVKQLLCVFGDSNAWQKGKNQQRNNKHETGLCRESSSNAKN